MQQAQVNPMTGGDTVRSTLTENDIRVGSSATLWRVGQKGQQDTNRNRPARQLSGGGGAEEGLTWSDPLTRPPEQRQSPSMTQPGSVGHLDQPHSAQQFQQTPPSVDVARSFPKPTSGFLPHRCAHDVICDNRLKALARHVGFSQGNNSPQGSPESQSKVKSKFRGIYAESFVNFP